MFVPFPFSDHQRRKNRPAIIISGNAYNCNRPDAVLMAVTSQVRTPLAFGEFELKDWNAAGLPKPSVIKPTFWTMEQRLLTRRLGHLSDDDCAALRKTIRSLLD